MCAHWSHALVALVTRWVLTLHHLYWVFPVSRVLGFLFFLLFFSSWWSCFASHIYVFLSNGGFRAVFKWPMSLHTHRLYALSWERGVSESSFLLHISLNIRSFSPVYLVYNLARCYSAVHMWHAHLSSRLYERRVCLIRLICEPSYFGNPYRSSASTSNCPIILGSLTTEQFQELSYLATNIVWRRDHGIPK